MKMTKWLGVGGVFAVCSLGAGSAFAQAAPPAQVGFQMALRTGYSVPMGAADKTQAGTEEKMSDFTTGQVPFVVDLGGKVIPNLFVGGYLGFGFGGVAGQTKAECDLGQIDCASVSVRIGVEGQYHFIPDGATNPWLGYGFGYESLALGGSKNGQNFSVSVSGLQPINLMGGVDFRVSKVFGVGPYVEYSMGTYTHVHAEIPGLVTIDQSISSTAMHSWLTFGARFVFFP